MKPNEEEHAAYSQGFDEMLLKIKSGEIPSSDSIAEELTTLLSLAKNMERASDFQRAENLEIKRVVATERNCAQIPAHRFAGRTAALLEYARACRAHNFEIGPRQS